MASSFLPDKPQKKEACGWRVHLYLLLSVQETSKYHSIFCFNPQTQDLISSAQQLIGSLFTRQNKMETQCAFFFGSCACKRSWRLKSPVSAPAGAPLSVAAPVAPETRLISRLAFWCRAFFDITHASVHGGSEAKWKLRTAQSPTGGAASRLRRDY